MNVRNNNARVASNKPFCKVCKDAGKQEKDYTNHWVKTLDRLTGKMITTCPTLLSQECRYCHQFGHTAKYCETLTDKVKYDKEKVQPLQKHSKSSFVDENKKHVASTKKVSFAVLSYDSDEEEQLNVPLPQPVAEPVLTGWAAIVAKPAPEPKPVERFRGSTTILKQVPGSRITRMETPSIAEGMEESLGFEPTLIPKPTLTRSEVLGRPAPIRRKPGKSWADDDSDEDVEMETPKSLKMFDDIMDINYKQPICKAYDFDPTW